MKPGEEIKVEAIIHGARMSKDGDWLLTLAVPLSEGGKVAALTAYVETVFKVTFKPEA